jgi:hypothetical protein
MSNPELQSTPMKYLQQLRKQKEEAKSSSQASNKLDVEAFKKTVEEYKSQEKELVDKCEKWCENRDKVIKEHNMLVNTMHKGSELIINEEIDYYADLIDYGEKEINRLRILQKCDFPMLNINQSKYQNLLDTPQNETMSKVTSHIANTHLNASNAIAYIEFTLLKTLKGSQQVFISLLAEIQQYMSKLTTDSTRDESSIAASRSNLSKAFNEKFTVISNGEDYSSDIYKLVRTLIITTQIYNSHYQEAFDFIVRIAQNLISSKKNTDLKLKNALKELNSYLSKVYSANVIPENLINDCVKEEEPAIIEGIFKSVDISTNVVWKEPITTIDHLVVCIKGLQAALIFDESKEENKLLHNFEGRIAPMSILIAGKLTKVHAILTKSKYLHVYSKATDPVPIISLDLLKCEISISEVITIAESFISDREKHFSHNAIVQFSGEGANEWTEALKKISFIKSQ